MKEYTFKREFTQDLDKWLKTEEKVFYISGPEHVGKETSILKWLKKKPNLVMYTYNEESKQILLNLNECIDSLVYKDTFYDEDNILVIFNAERLENKLQDIIKDIKECDKIQCKVLIVANMNKYSGGEDLIVDTLSYKEFQYNLSGLVNEKYITEDYYKIVGGYPTALLKFIQGTSYNFSESILISIILEAHFSIRGKIIRNIKESVYNNGKDLRELQRLYDKIIENMIIRHEIIEDEIVDYLLDTMILVRNKNNTISFHENGLFLASVVDKRVWMLANNQNVDIKELIEINRKGFKLVRV